MVSSQWCLQGCGSCLKHLRVWKSNAHYTPCSLWLVGRAFLNLLSTVQSSSHIGSYLQFARSGRHRNQNNFSPGSSLYIPEAVLPTSRRMILMRYMYGPHLAHTPDNSRWLYKNTCLRRHTYTQRGKFRHFSSLSISLSPSLGMKTETVNAWNPSFLPSGKFLLLLLLRAGKEEAEDDLPSRRTQDRFLTHLSGYQMGKINVNTRAFLAVHKCRNLTLFHTNLGRELRLLWLNFSLHLQTTFFWCAKLNHDHRLLNLRSPPLVCIKPNG